jgi:hypothetical protein
MREFMSEYQYYEFQSVDRRLSDKEMQELRAYSTRAHITPTSFANEYSFGDFKGNPDAWMEKYFDAFLYVANWGTHEFKLGLPAKVLSVNTARLIAAAMPPPCARRPTSWFSPFSRRKRAAASGFREMGFSPRCCRSALSWHAVICGVCT